MTGISPSFNKTRSANTKPHNEESLPASKDLKTKVQTNNERESTMTMEFGTLEDAIGCTTILARTGSEIIGSLQLTAPRAFQDNARLVLMVQVEETHRRKGVATALWKFAKDNGFNPIHELEQTQDGKAWARVVGD